MRSVSTCNAPDCVSGSFLKTRGRNGRVGIDQPMCLTEFEMGFQVWGESPDNVTSYFYARAPEQVAYSAARWFSRGGVLISLYLLSGGNNFGRFAGASVTTAYAQDAPICPDLLPHEPVYTHLAKLFGALASSAGVLLSQPAQFDHGVRLDPAHAELMCFDYGGVSFLENDGDQAHTVSWRDVEYSLAPRSILLVDAQRVLYDSADVSGATQGRRVITAAAGLSGDVHWDVWREPLLPCDTAELPAVVQATPAELVALTAGLSEYAWYETNVSVNARDAVLRVTASTSLALVVWVDGEPLAAGARTIRISQPDLRVAETSALSVCSGEPRPRRGARHGRARQGTEHRL